MPELSPIDDDEIILRHIPSGSTWQAAGPRITSLNFRPRTIIGESDLSVNRLRFTTPERLVELVKGDAAQGSRVAWVTAGAVRALGLRVEPKPIEPDDLGHSSIESTDAADLGSQSIQRKLALIFQFVEGSISASPSPT